MMSPEKAELGAAPVSPAPTAPAPDRFGLMFDVRKAGCPADPFENEAKYPGVKIGARGTTFSDGKTLPVGSYFGYPTGRCNGRRKGCVTCAV